MHKTMLAYTGITNLIWCAILSDSFSSRQIYVSTAMFLLCIWLILAIIIMQENICVYMYTVCSLNFCSLNF